MYVTSTRVKNFGHAKSKLGFSSGLEKEHGKGRAEEVPPPQEPTNKAEEQKNLLRTSSEQRGRHGGKSNVATSLPPLLFSYNDMNRMAMDTSKACRGRPLRPCLDA